MSRGLKLLGSSCRCGHRDASTSAPAVVLRRQPQLTLLSCIWQDAVVGVRARVGDVHVSEMCAAGWQPRASGIHSPATAGSSTKAWRCGGSIARLPGGDWHVNPRLIDFVKTDGTGSHRFVRLALLEPQSHHQSCWCSTDADLRAVPPNMMYMDSSQHSQGP